MRLPWQDGGHLLCRPAARQRYHRLDAVGLGLVASATVFRRQLLEFFGGEGIVEHRTHGTSASAGYAKVPKENLR
jgi:hypothetical protein